MDIVEISNLFNTIARMHTGVESYHFGWPSDRARNVPNNFDDANLGNYFPRVTWAPPEGTEDILSLRDEIEVTLYFDDLQGYDETAGLVNKTQAEQWRDLRDAALRFLREVNAAGHKLLKEQGDGIRIRDNRVRWSLDSFSGQQRLITVIARFTLDTATKCIDLSLDYDNDVPAGWEFPPSSASDLENILPT